MIRVELLGQRRRWSPWSKTLLAAVVVCGGLYGIHHLFPALAGSLVSADSAPQQATEPKPTAQQETTPNPVAQQETTSTPVQEVAPSPIVQQEIEPKPVAQQETTPTSGAQQEITPGQESEPEAQQEVALSSMAQQETTPNPVQREATPQAPSSQRSTACHQVMRIDEQVPAGLRVASLKCDSTGEYWLEGTSPSYKVLREFRLRLQALPSGVSFSTWQEERKLRFTFQGRFAERDTPPLAVLSSDQAEQFSGKVTRWADASGLDSLSIEEPTHRVSASHSRQRQKLRGIGSPQQIDAFLQQLQQVEDIATLGEVLLMPVQSDERGWVRARLYAAVDILVEAPQ